VDDTATSPTTSPTVSPTVSPSSTAPKQQVVTPTPKSSTLNQQEIVKITQLDSNKGTEKKIVAPQEIKTSFVMSGERIEHREKMSVLRRKVGLRLKESQNTNALLTTFNEIDMGHIIDVRKQFQEEFSKKHNVKLGFMGFFLKASAYALET